MKIKHLRTSFWIANCLLIILVGLFFWNEFPSDPRVNFKNWITGVILGGSGVIFVVIAASSFVKATLDNFSSSVSIRPKYYGGGTPEFLDVDLQGERRLSDPAILKLQNELAELRKKVDSTTKTEEIGKLFEDYIQAVESERKKALSTFTGYFSDIARVLEEKANNADKKASILLDKGMAYTKGGIIFYISAIVGWQVLANRTGYQPQYLYGMISCGVLFAFVEFLSAWFLKQYRQFVDTSTYLIKVKSIFDRYMLLYLASSEATAVTTADSPLVAGLLEALKADIKWPDSYLGKEPDVSFAKEFLTSFTEAAKVFGKKGG